MLDGSSSRKATNSGQEKMLHFRGVRITLNDHRATVIAHTGSAIKWVVPLLHIMQVGFMLI